MSTRIETPELPDKAAIRIDRAAEWLDIGRSTAYRLVREGKIPTVRIGSELRVRVKDLETYLDNLEVVGEQ
jgi:excisionase family DNA binding protein